MELEVKRIHGIPAETGVISVRAGHTRRQALVTEAMQEGGKLKFPLPAEEGSTVDFKVDVLDLLGSTRFNCDASQKMYDTHIELQKCGTSETMQVDFTVRRLDDDASGALFRGDDESSVAYKNRKEMAAREYLEEHGLVSFMHFLMQSLMKDKPEDPYVFLQKQIAMRVEEPATIGERANGYPNDPFNVSPVTVPAEDKGLERLLNKLTPEGSSVVTADQLAQLEREAAQAGDRLRKDNSSLRDCAGRLQAEYDKLVEESARLRHQVASNESPSGNRAVTPIVSQPASPSMISAHGETPQVAAYREIACMQDDVTNLAKENQELVQQLSKMRHAIDTIRKEMEQEMRAQ